MDKRKGSTHARSRGRVKGQSGHPGSSRRKGRPMTTGRGRNGRSGTRHAKKVNRARKRRNKILFIMIIILLIMILKDIHTHGVSRCEDVEIQFVRQSRLHWFTQIFRSCVLRKECQTSQKTEYQLKTMGN